MKIWAVTYIDVNKARCEMCYPAMDVFDAMKLCKKDYPRVWIVEVEEV